jgi:hypothetical protein
MRGAGILARAMYLSDNATFEEVTAADFAMELSRI